MSEVFEKVEVLDRAEISGSKVVVQYSATEAALSDLRTKYAGVVFDLTTTKGDKEARAARLELVTLRTSLEKKRKEFKAPALDFGKKIDSEAERISKEIVALESHIDLQIKADEKRRADEKAERDRIEAARVQCLRDKIEQIRACLTRCEGITAERIATGIALVEKLDVSEAVFLELAPEAASTKEQTLAAMRKLHTSTLEREFEAARVEAQRIENERVADEQRKTAQALADQQAALDKAAADLAERERIAAESAKVERIVTAPSVAPAATPLVTPAVPNVTHEAVVSLMPTTVRQAMAPAKVDKPDSEPTLKVGEISERLGFTLTADFIKVLGFEPAKVDRASKLFHEEDFPAICAALINHISEVSDQFNAVAA